MGKKLYNYQKKVIILQKFYFKSHNFNRKTCFFENEVVHLHKNIEQIHLTS